MTRTADRRDEAGFTLVEMAVASVLILLALLVAAQILDESGRVLAHSVARERDTWTPLASEWLRSDLRRATGAYGGDLFPQDTPLMLTESFGSVTWSRVGDTLVREEAGAPPKKLLDHVELWRWQIVPAPNGTAVEAEVRFRRASSFLHFGAGGVPQRDLGKLESLHWLVLLRGARLTAGGGAGVRGW